MQIRKIRLEKGLSKPTLSALSGVPLRTIENVERTDDCMVSTALRLAAGLGVDMNTLCEET